MAPSKEITFGEWLHQQRRMLDLTQQDLADQVGCARITLRRIESGALKPSKGLAQILLEKLGAPQAEREAWLRFARGLSGFPEGSARSFASKPITNLPTPLTSFIGREKEQAEVINLINKYRLITLVGTGGVGKTRLSLKVGEQMLGDYANGVWLVELAPILDPLLVPRTTAIAIGLRDEPQRPVIEMLSDYLREKEMLILLDNCEHLLDACAQLADMLLRSCPSLKILATSREVLGILGEATYHVPSLGLPDLQQLLENLREAESMRLFEERAQLVQMNFLLTMENAANVAKICNQLDGIPLAIELAAARVSTFSTEQIAARLQESFNLLTSGNRTALPRHQTLQAAIDGSYDLLSPAEQTLFRRLSVFANGWTLEAAEFVCSDANIKSEEASDLLAQLIKKSLVNTEYVQGKTRYRMLETIRQYAKEKLVKSEESNLLHDRHLDYFLNIAETAAPYLIRPEQLEWLARLDADYENLRAVLEWAVTKDSPEFSLRLCAALGRFWSIRCYWIEGSKWLESALAKPTKKQTRAEKVARVKALYQDANLANELDDMKRLKTSAELSLALAEQNPDKQDIAIARFYVGFTFLRLEVYEKAYLLLEQSLIEFRELGDLYWEAYTQRWLSMSLAGMGKKSLGETIVPDLEMARRSGERDYLASALFRQAQWEWENNQITEAELHLKESESLCDEIGTMNSWASFLQGLIGHYSHDDFYQAKILYAKSKEQCELNGLKNAKSLVVVNLGILARDEGNLQQAQAHIEEALRIAKEVGNRDSVGFRLALLGQIELLQGNLEGFKQHLNEGLLIAKETKNNESLFIFSSSYPKIKPQIAVQVLGAVHASSLEHKKPLNPFLIRESNLVVSQTRKVLDDVSFDTAFEKGQKMTIDEAFDLALKTVEEI